MALTAGVPTEACWGSVVGLAGCFLCLGGGLGVCVGSLVAEMGCWVGMVNSGGGCWVGGGAVEVSSLGASGWAGCLGVLCRKHPVRSNGSTHATILAGNFIPQALSRFQRSPAVDAGVPSPWRRAEFATGTPSHGPPLIVLL